MAATGLDWQGLRDFVQDVFGSQALAARVWTTGFASSGSGENWRGGFGLDWLEQRFGSGDADLYWVISPMKPGAARRSNGEVDCQPVLIVDDVGTKVDRAAWDRMFARGFPRPRARIETSPGNETWVWGLAGDVGVWGTGEWAADMARVRAWISALGLSDDVLDPARYVRLPAGWNSKPKYGPVRPRVGLLEWDRGGARASLDAMGAALADVAAGSGVNWRAVALPAGAGAAAQALLSSAQLGVALSAGALVRRADMGAPDEWIALAEELGLAPVQIRPGVVEALCPNMAAHGARAETGFAFLGGGLCHCNHASCQGLTTVDFHRMMDEAFGERQAAAAALGVLGAGEPMTGGAFRARRVFQGPAGALPADQDVNALAARGTAAVEGREAARIENVAGLAARYVWVNDVSAFMDRETRELIPERVFDTHKNVVPLIPAGGSGAKRARNMVINSGGVEFADGLSRVPGDLRPVVEVRGADGRILKMANIWRGSAVTGRRVRHPVEWLELVGHVLPGEWFRTWFIKRLAWCLQNPGQRFMLVPLVIGGQGIGKDAMMAAIRELFGPHNVVGLQSDRLGSEFNEWQVCDQVIVSELKMDRQGGLYNRVKEMFTAPEQWVTINEKFKTPYRLRVAYSMVAFSNHEDALAGWEADDRRWQVYLSPAQKRDPDWYREKLAGAMTPEALEGLRDYLLSMDLSDFGPFTGAEGAEADAVRQQVAGSTLAGAALWTFQSVQRDEGGRFADRHVLTLAEVEDAILADVANRRIAGTTDAGQVARGLRNAGWVSRGQIRARSGNSRVSLWVSPELAASGVLEGMPPKTLAESHAAEQKNARAAAVGRAFGP